MQFEYIVMCGITKRKLGRNFLGHMIRDLGIISLIRQHSVHFDYLEVCIIQTKVPTNKINKLPKNLHA